MASAQRSRAVVNLIFWQWATGTDKATALWNKTHPGIHVKWDLVTAGGNGTYAKMNTAIKAGNPPDLGQIEYQFLPTFETTGGLLDLSKYGASSLKSKFVSWTWNQVTLGNAVYAIPQDTGPMAMFYRADLFKKYNIAVPKTWADYAYAAAKLHKANKNYYITDFPPTDPGWFIGLEWQAGARWFRINGNSWKLAMNDTASRQVASYWQNLLRQKLVKTDTDFTDAWYHDLQSGGVATWVTAVWGANTIIANAPKTKGDWRVAPMPQWSANKYIAGNWGGSTTVAFKATKHPKEAAEFAEWLNTDPQSVKLMVEGAQLYPALQSALDTSAVNGPMAFYGNQQVNSVFHTASNHVDLTFQWGPTMGQVFTDINDQFSNAVNGKTTLVNALDALQASTYKTMKSQGFSVQQ
jgi:multiple sugar transport system substrate-binding protein